MALSVPEDTALSCKQAVLEGKKNGIILLAGTDAYIHFSDPSIATNCVNFEALDSRLASSLEELRVIFIAMQG